VNLCFKISCFSLRNLAWKFAVNTNLRLGDWYFFRLPLVMKDKVQVDLLQLELLDYPKPFKLQPQSERDLVYLPLELYNYFLHLSTCFGSQKPRLQYYSDLRTSFYSVLRVMTYKRLRTSALEHSPSEETNKIFVFPIKFTFFSKNKTMNVKFETP